LPKVQAMKLAAVGVALLALRCYATAQSPPPACSAAEHRQFDFWIGRWEVFTPDGAVSQHWETSQDDGATWATAFDGRYVKVK
jgi:hypothetical protein